jgi:serine/threonine protein kinase
MLKKLFGGGEKRAGAKPRKAKVNLARRYTLVAETAQGSMSHVYRAVDNQTGSSVCLKVQNVAKTAAAVARADRANRPDEGEAASKVVHPNVVRTIDYGLSTKGEHYIVMEFIDGVSLMFLRETRAVPRLEEKLELLAQAAEGLAAVHAAGFIHHDVGPRNFLVTRDRLVKMIDFGLTVPNTPAFCKPGNRTGTLNYMSPELLRRETIDERIDVFGFGVMAFEFLTDRLPYDSANSMTAMLQRINSEPLDPARANPNLPPELHGLLRKLTARRRAERWPKMATVADALRSIPAPVR